LRDQPSSANGNGKKLPKTGNIFPSSASSSPPQAHGAAQAIGHRGIGLTPGRPYDPYSPLLCAAITCGLRNMSRHPVPAAFSASGQSHRHACSRYPVVCQLRSATTWSVRLACPGRRATTTTAPRLASTRWPPSLSEPTSSSSRALDHLAAAEGPEGYRSPPFVTLAR
jgi:hypothetical protein